MTKSNLKEKEDEKKGQTPDMVFVTRIKLNKDRSATINYFTKNDKSAKEVIYCGKEAITDEFYDLFQQTKSGFTGVLNLLHPHISKITMNVLEFDYNKTDYLEKALYSVKYAFSEQNNAVVNISTPLLPIYKEEFGDKTFCISGKEVDALHAVIAAAKKYMNGETHIHQPDLGLKIVK